MNKNIPLSAGEALIHQARRRANAENTTLHDLFRDWLRRYVAQPSAADQYLALMARFRQFEAGRKFSREEMNEQKE
jgi:hypothetical protein